MRFLAQLIGLLIGVGGWQVLAPMMADTPVRGFIGVSVILLGAVIVLESRPRKESE
jgi:hypothetical protein